MRYPVVMLVALSAAVAACGDDNPATTVEDVDLPSEPDADGPWDMSTRAGCGLVMNDEIAGALGRPVTSQEEGGFHGCSWQTESDLVVLQVFPDASLPADACDENQTSMPYGQSAKGKLYELTDLGDSAIWGSSGDLLVCTGRGLLVVNFERSAANMSPDDEREAGIRIAKAALGRLAN